MGRRHTYVLSFINGAGRTGQIQVDAHEPFPEPWQHAHHVDTVNELHRRGDFGVRITGRLKVNR